METTTPNGEKLIIFNELTKDEKQKLEAQFPNYTIMTKGHIERRYNRRKSNFYKNILDKLK